MCDPDGGRWEGRSGSAAETDAVVRAVVVVPPLAATSGVIPDDEINGPFGELRLVVLQADRKTAANSAGCPYEAATICTYLKRSHVRLASFSSSVGFPAAMLPATSPIVRARGNGGGRPGRLTTCLHITSLVVCQSSSVKRTATVFSNAMLRTMIVPRRVGGRVFGSASVSRKTLAYGEGFDFGTGFVRSKAGSISCTRAAEAEDVIGEARTGNGKEELFSASVSVSVSSPGGREREAGLPVRLKTRMVSKPESFSAKCTFLLALGVEGHDCARTCLMGRSEMFGEEVDDLRDGLRGFPLERMMGVEGVRGREGDVDLDEVLDMKWGMNGEGPVGGEEGEEVGKGTAAGGSSGGISIRGGGSIEGENLPAVMERRRELSELRGE